MKISVYWVVVLVMMEGASTSEMLVNFYQTTWRNNPEDSHLCTRCCENLKSHKIIEVICPAYLEISHAKTFLSSTFINIIKTLKSFVIQHTQTHTKTEADINLLTHSNFQSETSNITFPLLHAHDQKYVM
jgi:hypothetical protein